MTQAHELLKDRDIDVSIEDGDVLVDVMVLAKVVQLDRPGHAVVLVSSEGHLDWIAEGGLLHAALSSHDAAPTTEERD